MYNITVYVNFKFRCTADILVRATMKLYSKYTVGIPGCLLYCQTKEVLLLSGGLLPFYKRILLTGIQN